MLDRTKRIDRLAGHALGRAVGGDEVREGGTCQLEALPPDVLASIVRYAIIDNLDMDLLEETREAERLERAELLGLPPGTSQE